MQNEAKRKIGIIETDDEGNKTVITELGDYPYSDNGEKYIEDIKDSQRAKKSIVNFQQNFMKLLAEMRIINANGFNNNLEVGALIILVLGAIPEKLLFIPKSKFDMSGAFGTAMSYLLPENIDIKYYINKLFPTKTKYNTSVPLTELFKPLMRFFRENQNYIQDLPELLDKIEAQTDEFVTKHQ